MLHFLLYFLTWACLTYCGLSGLIGLEEGPRVQSNHRYNSQARNFAENSGNVTLASNATTTDIDNARKVIKDAIAKMTILNKARLAKPAWIQYSLKPGTQLQKRSLNDTSPPLLNITEDIARAAALLANIDANVNSNFTAPPKINAGAFWMEGIQRKGSVPWETMQATRYVPYEVHYCWVS